MKIIVQTKKIFFILEGTTLDRQCQPGLLFQYESTTNPIILINDSIKKGYRTAYFLNKKPFEIATNAFVRQGMERRAMDINGYRSNSTYTLIKTHDHE